MAAWVGNSVEVIERHYRHAIPELEDPLAFLAGLGPVVPKWSLVVPESRKVVTRAGFEPTTPCSGGTCSIQLSYRATRGGTYWARTSDLCGVNTALYQLS